MTIPLTLRQQKGSPLEWSEVDNNFTALRNGIESVIAAGKRNLLINGNFQINQRGYVSGAATTGANQYTLDRWRVVTSGQNVTFSASGNGNQITAPAGGIEQVIEGINIGGGTYVLNWTGTATATVNGTARAKGESFTLPANTNATVRLIGGTASLVQLEPGSVATPFEHRPYGVELALCQRYYEVVSFGRRSNSSPVWSNATPESIVVSFKQEKRATPTIAEISDSWASHAREYYTDTRTVYVQPPTGHSGAWYFYDVVASATAEL